MSLVWFRNVNVRNVEQRRILKAHYFGHPESNEQMHGSFNAKSMSEILNISMKQKEM